MFCIDRRLRTSLVGLSLVAGCSSSPPPASSPTGPTTTGARAPTAQNAPNAARGATAVTLRLPSPGAVHNWNEVRLQAAHRMVAANPAGTYTGHVIEPLLAIPVLEIELNGDGSVRRIDVLRHPSQANDTTKLAADAVRRAAPFGDVSRLPKPWRFTETFLFDDERRFKPRTLDR